MKIRKMTKKDIYAVSELELQCFGTTDKDALENCLKNPAYNYMLADLGGSVVGMIAFLVVEDSCDIISVCVDRLHRQKGIASLLTQEMVKVLKSKSINQVFLEVRVSNVPAIKLYTNMGFEAVSVRKKYYDGIEDAIVMKCICK